ncbi:ATP-binding protein [Stella sp.]|uniref:ATP-binding protein n=1 Tax=Stella sp. TaxID=2912054 RepID=UPI0035B2EC4E
MTAGARVAAHIELPAEPASVSHLWDWLEERVGPLDPGPERMHALRLCAEEIATNIVLHAFPEGSAPGASAAAFRVRLETADGVRLVFEDEGVPFDPTAHAPPPAAGTIAEAEIGGLGLPLVRAFVRAMHYRRQGNTNRLTLVFDGSQGATAAAR